MPNPRKIALLSSLVLAGMVVMPALATAQEAGFAVELTPPEDAFGEMRVGVRQFGQAIEPASGYVRGCLGHVAGEGAAALFEMTEPGSMLAFSAHGEGLRSLVIETPDGLFRCALADEAGAAVAQIATPQAGRYRVWAGADEGAEIDARILAADRAISTIELAGLDVEQLGDPRAGRHLFTATPETGRQILVAGGRLFPEEELRPLDRDYCPGYSRLDAADAVLVLDAPEQMLSIFAMSERDLTLAVVAPDGRVMCNDDTSGLDPAVTFDDAPAGDYQIFVGAFGQGMGGDLYDLYARPGAPQFAEPGAGVGGPPRVGQVTHDPRAALRGQTLASAEIVARQPADDLVPDMYCSGYVGGDAPDVTLLVEEPAEELSLYAVSSVDLVIAVQDPNGVWMCNDDASGVNPAVTFSAPVAGEYQIYVGAFARNAEGAFAAFAADGEPNWDDAQIPATATLDVEADPAIARFAFGPQTRPDPRAVFDVPEATFDAFDLGNDCAGYIDPTRPDMVIQAQDGLPQLMIYMVADGDGTLVVVGPDGTLYCNDDFEGLHPGVLIPEPAAGSYAVFAGTFDGRGGLATLGVTVANPNWLMDREG
jgi:hypothetical protein